MKSERNHQPALAQAGLSARAARILIAAGLSLFILAACANKKAGEEKKVRPAAQTGAQVPSFADRSKIPASGRQGLPGEAVSLAGDAGNGENLFVRNCAGCHGAQGTDKVPNPGSDDGTVPPLNPIDPALANKAPALFTANIDRYIQHGSIPDGSDPALFMPNWGDGKALSQQQIADLETYVMRLNGVTR
jgi:mono/diheme cytochrome c family protein